MSRHNNVFQRSKTAALLSTTSWVTLLLAGGAALAQQATPIPDVTVNAPLEPLMDGSAAAGYRVKDSTAAGPIWGDLPVQDTPYSISVIPAELIQNIQAYQPEQLIKVIPQITNMNAQMNSAGNPFFYVRGYTITQFTNGSGLGYDGLLAAGGALNNVLDDKEAVQLLSGADAFLYGTGSLAGTINYTLKRPTATPLFDITMGPNAGKNGYVHGDFGGPLNIPGLADGLLGFRLNLVDQGGDIQWKNENIQRQVISGALDIHVTEDLLVQLNAAHYRYKSNGETAEAFVTYATNTLAGKPYVPYPTPPNPQGFGDPSWDAFTSTANNAGVKISYKINDIFSIRAFYDYTNELRPDQTNCSIDYPTQTSGVQSLFCGIFTNYFHTYTNSAYTFLDAKFDTFGAEHRVVTGFTGFASTSLVEQLGTSSGSATFATSLNQTTFQPEPPQTLNFHSGPGYVTTKVYAKNFVLGDEIKFHDFILFAGANYTDRGVESYNLGKSNTGYSNAAISPTASLVYKITPWLSAYATYQHGGPE
jgi:iron complex outermembrane recepter protein